MSPLCTQKWRYIGLLLTAHFHVTSVFCLCVLFSPSIMQAVKHETLTQCRTIVGPPLRCWANISPVLGYCVVFDATLHVGQRHRRRANITQFLFKASCGYYSQHEVGLLTTVEWILASTGDAGPTFTRNWVGVGLHCLTRSPANTRRWTSAGFMLGQCRRRWARIRPALGQRLVFAGSVDRPHLCFAHQRVWRYYNCCPTDWA